MASAEEIAAYGYRAGWRGNDLAVAVAVALAESSGRTDAVGDTALQNDTWGPSVGLWQIRSLNADRGTGKTRDELANKDPQTNANHAHEIWKGSGWGAWSTYSNRAYLLYMPRALPAAAAANVAAPAVGVATEAADAAASVPRAILSAAAEPVRIMKWLQQPGTQLRIAKVVVGGALVVVAAYVFARPVVESAVDAGSKVAKVVM